MNHRSEVRSRLPILGLALALAVLAIPRTRLEPPTGPASRPGPPARARTLTPEAIPRLDDETRTRLAKGPRRLASQVEEDSILFGTRNPFVPLGLDDLELIRHPAPLPPVPAPETDGAPPAPDPARLGLSFHGLIAAGGRTFAVIGLRGRRIPLLVEEGQTVPGLPWQVLVFGPQGTSLVLVDAAAARDRDKVLVVPRGTTRDGLGATDRNALLASLGSDARSPAPAGSGRDPLSEAVLAYERQRRAAPRSGSPRAFESGPQSGGLGAAQGLDGHGAPPAPGSGWDASG